MINLGRALLAAEEKLQPTLNKYVSRVQMSLPYCTLVTIIWWSADTVQRASYLIEDMQVCVCISAVIGKIADG